MMNKHQDKMTSVYKYSLQVIGATACFPNLSKVTANPENMYKPVQNIFLLTHGTKYRNKYTILKSSLTNFIQYHEMLKSANGLNATKPFTMEYQSTN